MRAAVIATMCLLQQGSGLTAADADKLSAQMAALFSDVPPPSAAPPAGNVGYDPLVKAWLSSYLRDPYSAVVNQVRGPRQTSFKPDVWTKITGTAVCYDINAKNAYGGYTGVKRHLFIFDAGRVAYHLSMADERQNSLAPMLIRSECDLPANG